MKNKQSKLTKQSIVVDIARENEQFLREAIGFEWPLRDGDCSFYAQTQNRSPYGAGVWQHSIRIGIFQAPTKDDIHHWRFTSGRYWIKLEVARFRTNKYETRSGDTIRYEEIYFHKDDPHPPHDLIAAIVEQVKQYGCWERIV